MKSHYLGIDPGKTGAVCRICEGQIEIHDWSGFIDTAAKLREWNHDYAIIGAYIEDVHAMPHDGSVQAFRFGKNYGAWLMALSMLEIKTQLVTPKQWRKGIYRPEDRRPLKKRSLDAARGLFPDYTEYFSREMDHNRAEAALIAYQAERFFDVSD